MSITREIREYALQNPLASEVDIRDKFGVTRQLVSRLFNNIFTQDELEALGWLVSTFKLMMCETCLSEAVLLRRFTPL
jgi:hypothetical protein